jgi:7-cyano-7-deazaguanine synthase
MKSLIILSGGLDSTTLLYDLLNEGHNVNAITFNYGQRHKKEILKAEQTCKKLNVAQKIVGVDCLNNIAPSALTRNEIQIPYGSYTDENMKITVVPNRNMVLLSLALSYAITIDAECVYYGAHAGDHTIYPDCREVFVKAMNNAAMLCDFKERQIKAPYLLWDKADIVKRGLELGVDYSLTWTCYKGELLACGKCGSCVERLEAFALNNTTDTIEYK